MMTPKKNVHNISRNNSLMTVKTNCNYNKKLNLIERIRAINTSEKILQFQQPCMEPA